MAQKFKVKVTLEVTVEAEDKVEAKTLARMNFAIDSQDIGIQVNGCTVEDVESDKV